MGCVSPKACRASTRSGGSTSTTNRPSPTAACSKPTVRRSPATRRGRTVERSMRVMITGCAGFIGSHLTEAFLVDGHEVLGVDCFNDNYARDAKLSNLRTARNWDGFEFVPID